MTNDARTPSQPAGAAAPARVRVGTQGWNYPDWVGGFYPAGTRPADFLSVYARAFDAVEVDSTFYAVPALKTVRGWASRTPQGFTFTLKFPQEATHERRLVDCGTSPKASSQRRASWGPSWGRCCFSWAPTSRPTSFPRSPASFPWCRQTSAWR